jgi:hypothetical protein
LGLHFTHTWDLKAAGHIDFGLLCDHREVLVNERTRLINRLRINLVILDPELEVTIPARIGATSLCVVQEIGAHRAHVLRGGDPVRLHHMRSPSTRSLRFAALDAAR